MSMDLSIADTLRQNARDVVSQARTAYISPYEEWTSDELRDLLVMYKVPIRDSANATHEMLVRICDEVFGEEIAESERDSIESRRLSLEDVIVMERAARMIQKAYFRRKILKRSQSSDFEYDELYMDYDFDDIELGEESDFSSLDHTQSSTSSQKSKAPVQKYRHHSILRKINEQGDDYDEEIEVEWRKPSWKFAKRHERMVRPHRAGKRMAPYDWKKVTLGRHCYAGGCGEQLDLWNEGRTSEFSQFGSGITNYFKVRTLWFCFIQ
jgi:hypothetical protein